MWRVDITTPKGDIGGRKLRRPRPKRGRNLSISLCMSFLNVDNTNIRTFAEVGLVLRSGRFVRDFPPILWTFDNDKLNYAEQLQFNMRVHHRDWL